MIGLLVSAALIAASGQYQGLVGDIEDTRRRLAALRSGETEARSRAEEAAAPVTLHTSNDFQRAVRTEIVALLRDPGSAQFRNVRQSPTSIGGAKFCGELNSRNGFGGYTGYVRFLAFAAPSGRMSVELDNQDGMVGAYFNASWNQNCSSQGGVPVSL